MRILKDSKSDKTIVMFKEGKKVAIKLKNSNCEVIEQLTLWLKKNLTKIKNKNSKKTKKIKLWQN